MIFMKKFDELIKWWQGKCDGEWEHEFGVVLTSMDNPGWLLKIDVAGEDDHILPLGFQVSSEFPDGGWIKCHVASGSTSGSPEEHLRHFVGMGGAGNLSDILDVFFEAIQQSD